MLAGACAVCCLPALHSAPWYLPHRARPQAATCAPGEAFLLGASNTAIGVVGGNTVGTNIRVTGNNNTLATVGNFEATSCVFAIEGDDNTINISAGDLVESTGAEAIGIFDSADRHERQCQRDGDRRYQCNRPTAWVTRP